MLWKMNHRSITAAATIILCVLSCARVKNDSVNVISPDGRFVIEFRLKSAPDDGNTPFYSVFRDGNAVIAESELGVEFLEGGLLKKGLRITNVSSGSHDETYAVPFGKFSTARNHYNETVVSLKESAARGLRFDLVFRAYDDGVAFRYYFPEQPGMAEINITSEQTCFSLPVNSTAWAPFMRGFTTSQEVNYPPVTLGEISPDSLLGVPLLLQLPGKIWLALTEANLTDYAGMYLTVSPDNPGVLVSTLSPRTDDPEVKVKASVPHPTPWRVIMIADDPGRLVESNLVLNLNEPCRIEDVSWIKTGKSAFLWWNDFVVSGVKFKGGLNTRTFKYYIDFCAENGFEFFDIDTDEKNDWYGDRNDPESDITTAIPQIDMQELLSYAKAKGVGPRLWLPWYFVRDQMDKAFPVYEKWGISCLKIDYMDRDDQEMVNFYHAVVKKAAKHHLTVNFHGAYKPTGLRRSYPNLITREGVLGLEYNKWSRKCTPEHAVTIPFTRMLAGPMDFTPGSFRNVAEKEFQPVNHAPVAMGTRCLQLAMYVVYESPVQMLSDYPAALSEGPGLDFLRKVPTTWDETMVLAGSVGDFITIARCHGKDWYVGSMTDWTARELALPLDFLPSGDFAAEIYSDNLRAESDPSEAVFSSFLVSASDTLAARLAPGGGQAVRLSPAAPGSTLPRYSAGNR
jgi:alpha-glucosidase